MKIRFEVQRLLRGGKRKWVIVVGIVAITHILLFQFSLPDGNINLPNENNGMMNPSPKTLFRGTLAVNVSNVSAASEKNGYVSSFGYDEGLESQTDVVRNTTAAAGLITEDDNSLDLERFQDSNDGAIIKQVAVMGTEKVPIYNYGNQALKDFRTRNDSLSLQIEMNLNSSMTSSGSLARSAISLRNSTVLGTSSLLISTNIKKKKKLRCDMPPETVTTIDEMNQILARNRRSSRAIRPRWASRRDDEMLAARKEIENAPAATNERELYPPIFRNISMFKRSYDVMERTLKVYVYKEGRRPIFHTPILKGLYASEGWFMKLMEGNKQYTVKDPRKAHLYYMPFSARMLEYKLYVRNSHNRTNLRQFLKEYTEHISSKYPFFNRTGGADHFLVACHDWAPYETRHHMEHCIKALCNADPTTGFKIGRDVSLPETYVRSAKNPLRDLGGKPASQRQILAFYAGSIHGYLRPILLHHWKDKDPEMNILERMPRGVASKMNYIEHMKSSKYCICPKGFEVNSPRVVESIFYECVPVIISDNFVPPFFEVLDWDAFSVIVAEKDIGKLKDILSSIPEERYLKMQMAVRKVQKHFLWHAKPEKYDLFHMILHSIWYNRVFQAKRR